MIKPEFTEEQQNYLAEVIGHWYLHWKHGIVDHEQGKPPAQHRLGYAKETLKELIYWPENTREYIEACFRHGMFRQALALMERYPDLKVHRSSEEEQNDG